MQSTTINAQSIVLSMPECYALQNGLNVHLINEGAKDVVKLELIFNGGRWVESNKGVSAAAARMLQEGTKLYDSEGLAGAFENLGATLKILSNGDHLVLSVYALTKHMEETLELVGQILEYSTFPAKELKHYKTMLHEQHLVNERKVEYHGQKIFFQNAFGANHPYGYKLQPDDIDLVTRLNVIDHFDACIRPDNCIAFLSGKFDSSTLDLLDEYIGRWNVVDEGERFSGYHELESSYQYRHVKLMENSVQTAIRMGKPMFTKRHGDYWKMMVLNTVFGGYFGSRLMQNVREEKGYSYGIYSAIQSYQNSGVFYIAAEVNNEFAAVTVKEIYKEIERLKTEKISDAELTKVRNYMLGNMMSSVDGPFNKAEVLKNLVIYGLDTSYFYEGIQTIQSVNANELQELAKIYLDESTIYEVVVGQPA